MFVRPTWTILLAMHTASLTAFAWPPAVLCQELTDEWQAARAHLHVGSRLFRSPSEVNGFAVSPDDSTIVTLGHGQLIAWDADTGRPRWQATSVDVGGAAYGGNRIAFAADSKTFFTPGKDGQIVRWHIADGTSNNNRTG